MGSKNNPKNRGTADQGKQYNGKPVKPVRYNGGRVGHGNFMAAESDDGQLILDHNGRPIPWESI